MTVRTPYLSTIALASLLLPLFACSGEDAKTCLDDRSCGAGLRCMQERFGAPGTCQPCDPTETPYDGVDNDCNTRTPDSDLDGDGDNWAQAPSKPGTDCDDDDSTVSGKLSEVCSDRKDNDCDTRVDEPECADRELPTVRFLSPANDALVSGTFTIQVAVADDVGVTGVSVTLNGSTLESRTFTPATLAETITLQPNSENFTDGRVTIEARVTDVAGQTVQAMVVVDIDNRSGPVIEFVRPQPGGAYGGMLQVEANITDPSGVGAVQLEFDGTMVQSFTAPPYRWLIDTTSLSEGDHRVRFTAVDQGPMVSTIADSTFKVDNTPPVVIITEPQANDMLTGPVDVQVSATDANGVAQISVAGTTGPSPLSFTLNSALLPNGQYTLTATASDTAEVNGVGGNVGSGSVRVRVQNNSGGPTVVINSPSDGDEVTGATQVSVAATAPAGTVSRVEFYLDGQLAATDATAPFTAVIDFTGLTGPHQLQVTAFAGAQMASTTITVSVVAPPPFRTAQTVSSDTLDASNIDIYDLDTDGVLDFVSGGQSPRILFGATTADGRWRSKRILPFGATNAGDVRVVNPDGSGPMIVLMLNQQVNFYRFTAPAQVTSVGNTGPIGSGLSWMEFGDIDDDGDLDLVLGSVSSAGIVLEWDNGSYTLSQTIGGLANAAQIKLHDVDQDTDLDLIVGRTGGASFNLFSVYLNDGTGQYGASRDTPTGFPPERFAVADVDTDGDDDLVFQGGNRLTLFLADVANPGSYTVSHVVNSVVGGRGILLRDVDTDGDLDWVVANGTLSGAEFLRVDDAAMPPVRARGFLMCDGFGRPRFRDINQDGLEDLIGTCPVLGQIGIAYGRPGGAYFAAPMDLAPSVAVRSYAFADLTGGPEPELVMGGDNPNLIYVFGFDGQNWTEAARAPASGVITAMTLGDIDPSPGLELLGTIAGTALLGVQNTPLMFTTTTLNRSAASMAIGDITGDGTPEILLGVDGVGTNTDAVQFYGVTDTQPFFSQLIPSPTRIVVGNFDSDPLGTNEVGVLSSAQGNVTILEESGGTWVPTNFGLVSGANSALLVADVNMDGLNDVVSAGSSSLVILEGDVATGFAAPRIVPSSGVGLALAAGDFNGDGRIDLALSQLNRRVAIYLQRSNGSFLAPVIVPTVAEPRAIFYSDLNGDGRPDLVVGHTAGVPAIGTYLTETF